MLAIDTSGDYAYVALLLETGEQVDLQSALELRHSESLECLVRDALCELGVSVSDLGCIVIGKGPGSFTGLRVGFSFVKGLSIVNRIPVLAFPSMRAVAAVDSGLRAVVTDARRAECFCSLYAGDCESPRAIFEDELCGFELFGSMIEQHASGKNVKLFSALPDVKPQRGFLIQKWPNAASGLLILAKYHVKTKGWSNIADSWDLAALVDTEPNYVRGVAAKTIRERLDEKHSEA